MKKKKGMRVFTFTNRSAVPYRERSDAGELTEGQLHEVHGLPGQDEHDQIRDQECSCHNSERISFSVKEILSFRGMQRWIPSEIIRFYSIFYHIYRNSKSSSCRLAPHDEADRQATVLRIESVSLRASSTIFRFRNPKESRKSKVVRRSAEGGTRFGSKKLREVGRMAQL